MPAAILSHTALTLALAALGVGPGPGDPLPEPIPPVTEIHQVFYAVEGSRLSALLPVEIPFEAPGGANVLVTRRPIYGQLDDEAWPSFTYRPDGDFFGRDRLTVEVYGSHSMVRVEIEIDVLPSRIPLVGRWAKGAALAVGLYDPLGGWLQRCSPEPGESGTDDDLGAYGTLICSWAQVRGAPPAAIPLVLPGAAEDAGGASRLALFDQSSGTLYFLSDQGSVLVVDQTETYPGAVDRFPVAGNFGDSDQATIAFVGRGGEVGMLGSRGDWIDWSFRLELNSGDELPWPIRWPLQRGDALARLDIGAAKLDWWTADGDTGYLKNHTRSTAVAVPFWPNRETGHDAVSLLWRSSEGLFLVNYIFVGIYDPSPQTIPLKFPNDPPGP